MVVAALRRPLTNLGQVIRIDDERVRDYLRNVMRGVEETLNAMLEAEPIGCAMPGATGAPVLRGGDALLPHRATNQFPPA